MCLFEYWQQAHPDTMMELVCIRPRYVWPAQVLQQERELPLCSEEGIALCAGRCTTTRFGQEQRVRAIDSALGCLGPSLTFIAVPASQAATLLASRGGSPPAATYGSMCSVSGATVHMQAPQGGNLLDCLVAVALQELM
jgi:hypothetical protein